MKRVKPSPRKKTSETVKVALIGGAALVLSSMVSSTISGLFTLLSRGPGSPISGSTTPAPGPTSASGTTPTPVATPPPKGSPPPLPSSFSSPFSPLLFGIFGVVLVLIFVLFFRRFSTEGIDGQSSMSKNQFRILFALGLLIVLCGALFGLSLTATLHLFGQ